MKAHLSHISVIKSATVFGIVNFFLFLVLTNAFFLIGLLVGERVLDLGEWETVGKGIYALAAPVLSILLSMILGVLAFLQFILFAFIYNLVARGTGGVEFTLKEIEQ